MKVHFGDHILGCNNQNSFGEYTVLVLKNKNIFNLFHATDIFQYPLKIPENPGIPVFRGHRKRQVA